ncbi:hypothetical protein ACWGJ0_21000 [Streptomyces massasporeus]
MANALVRDWRMPIGEYSVLRTTGTVTVSILPSRSDTMVGQCYRFTLPIARDGQRSATAVPASSC